jgi:hypothetical protein
MRESIFKNHFIFPLDNGKRKVYNPEYELGKANECRWRINSSLFLLQG